MAKYLLNHALPGSSITSLPPADCSIRKRHTYCTHASVLGTKCEHPGNHYAERWFGVRMALHKICFNSHRHRAYTILLPTAPTVP
eukprot:5566018-Prymnesium_polylepis.1